MNCIHKTLTLTYQTQLVLVYDTIRGDMETPQHGNDSTRKRIKNYF